MEEQDQTLRGVFPKRRSASLLRGILLYLRTRRPSDKFILTILGFLVILSSVLCLLILEQSILVTEPAYGGSLTEGDVGAPRFINPLLAISSTDQDLSALAYAGLMGEGPDGNLVPVLAKSYTISPDGKTYTFTLRDNLKFSDGTPVTASDVVYTVQKAQDPALKSPQYSDWNNVVVTAINSTTVQFTLPEPYAPFLQDTTLGILPAHLWQNVTDDEFPFSDLMIKPVGAGPFVATHLSQDSNGNITKYTVVANQNYALGRPYLDRINFIFYPDQPSLQTAISKGKVESGYGVLGTHMLTASYSRVFAVFFNAGENSTFSDEAVRQALSLAIDRNAIVHNTLGGYATALMGPVPPGSGISEIPVAASTSPELIANSTSILEGDGWTFASSTNEWVNRSGNTLSVTLKTSNVPELTVMAQAIQANWEALGVPTTIEYYEPGQLTQDVIQPRAYQALLFGMVVAKGDDLYDFWDSQEKTDPGLNITSYSNPAVDTLLSDLRSETDPNQRIQDLTQINQDIAADYPAAFIESPDFVYVVPNDLKGVILPQITSPSDRFATVATWYRRTESVWPFLARNK